MTYDDTPGIFNVKGPTNAPILCGPLTSRAYFDNQLIVPNPLFTTLPLEYRAVSKQFTANSVDTSLIGKEFEYKIEVGFARYFPDGPVKAE